MNKVYDNQSKDDISPKNIVTARQKKIIQPASIDLHCT